MNLFQLQGKRTDNHSKICLFFVYCKTLTIKLPAIIIIMIFTVNFICIGRYIIILCYARDDIKCQNYRLVNY